VFHGKGAMIKMIACQLHALSCLGQERIVQAEHALFFKGRLPVFLHEMKPIDVELSHFTPPIAFI